MTPNSVQQFFSESLQQLVTNEILNEIQREDFPKENVSVDFYLKEGKMRCSKPWNTQFQFDADNLVHCKSILNFLIESEDPLDEDISFFEEWRSGLSSLINDKISNSFKSQIRNLVFQENNEDLFPINFIKVIDVDITNRPENDMVLVVRKDAPQGIQTQSVTAELIKEWEETGKDVNEIIEEKKKNENSKYKWVTSASWRKHFYDITVSLMIDYTPNLKPLVNNSI